MRLNLFCNSVLAGDRRVTEFLNSLANGHRLIWWCDEPTEDRACGLFCERTRLDLGQMPWRRINEADLNIFAADSDSHENWFALLEQGIAGLLLWASNEDLPGRFLREPGLVCATFRIGSAMSFDPMTIHQAVKTRKLALARGLMADRAAARLGRLVRHPESVSRAAEFLAGSVLSLTTPISHDKSGHLA